MAFHKISDACASVHDERSHLKEPRVTQPTRLEEGLHLCHSASCAIPSPRELEILQAAVALNMSTRTAESHRRIMHKM
jgi:hypothetical protein